MLILCKKYFLSVISLFLILYILFSNFKNNSNVLICIDLFFINFILSRCCVTTMARWYSLKTRLDCLATATFFLGGIFLLWYELYFVAAFYHSGWSLAYLAHVYLGAIFTINIYGNWLMIVITDSSGSDIVFPTGPTPPGWHYCDACEANRPPRSHHCPCCKTCILKHDHHCWFAGRCIGYSNHRYFFVLVIYMALAGIYCNIYNWQFVWSVRGEVTFLNLLSFIAPHFTMMLGNESFYTFFIAILSFIGFSLTILSLWLLQLQLAQIIHNQTRYEKKKKMLREYDQGLWANLQDVIGCSLFLALLCPFVPSKLPGDGVRFYIKAQKHL